MKIIKFAKIITLNNGMTTYTIFFGFSYIRHNNDANTNATQIDKIKFLIASAYFLVNDYSSSQKYFSQIINESEELSFLFSQTEKKYPNPNTAFWLSTILPGLGQFYVGDINSF